MRQSWNLRRNPRGRPQTLQRFLARVENLGLRCAFTIIEVLAIFDSFPVLYLPKGMPSSLSRKRACSSFVAVVTIVMFIPLALSTFE